MEHKETKKICILVGLGAVLISSNAFAAFDGSTTTPPPSGTSQGSPFMA